MKHKTPFQIQDPTEITQVHSAAAQLFLNQHEIPPTPANYSIAFEYAAKRNAKLNSEVDKRLARSDSLDGYFLAELFERFFIHNNYEDLDSHVTGIQQIITHALYGIATASDDFSGYETLLASQIEQLNDHPEMSHFRTIAANLLQATQQAMINNTRLKKRLAANNRDIKKLQEELDEIRQEVSTDALTGLFNRTALTNKLDQLLEAEVNPDSPVSVLLLDIDHFKHFNDTYGHLIGDEVIRRVASTLQQHSTAGNLAARYGGEEFTLVMPDTDIESALNLAQSIQDSVAKLTLIRRKTNERLPGITLSVGAASIRRGERQDDLLERAGQALYMAQNNGRNQLVSELQLAVAS